MNFSALTTLSNNLFSCLQKLRVNKVNTLVKDGKPTGFYIRQLSPGLEQWIPTEATGWSWKELPSAGSSATFTSGDLTLRIVKNSGDYAPASVVWPTARNSSFYYQQPYDVGGMEQRIEYHTEAQYQIDNDPGYIRGTYYFLVVDDLDNKKAYRLEFICAHYYGETNSRPTWVACRFL